MGAVKHFKMALAEMDPAVPDDEWDDYPMLDHPLIESRERQVHALPDPARTIAIDLVLRGRWEGSFAQLLTQARTQALDASA